MFKKISITTFINLLFVFSFTSTIVAFIFFLEWDKARYDQFQKQRYTMIANTFLTELQFIPTKEHLQELYKHFSVKQITSPNQLVNILKNSNILYIQESILGRIRVLEYKANHFIYIQNYGYNIMLKDKLSNSHSSIALFLFGLMTFVMFVLYVNFIKKFVPLSRLNAQVEEFANGNLQIKINDYGQDEIGKIAQNFKKAIHYINELIESKNLFMRNMLHELKTPITKGRIIAESIEDIEDKEILIKAFERMNEIISNLAQIERITLQTQELKKEKLYLNEVLDEVKKLLLYDINSKSIIENYKNIEFEADLHLFAIVLKNLIDNGKKFSPDNKVEIYTDDFSIQVISKGEPLKEPFKNYIEPFAQGEKRQSGFGLGLYIVKKILDIHDFDFEYLHKDQKNYFIINLYHCQVSYPESS